jgi:adenylate cyclase
MYPLVFFTANGPRESAPLTISRKVEGLPPITPEEVGAELLRSGIMSEWHKRSPDLVPPSEVERTAYRLSDSSLLWQPFESTTDLVPPAAFWVSYAPPLSDFKQHSFAQVLNEASPEDFRNRVVIIGFDAEIDPSSDSYAIPTLLGKASSAQVVAYATATILDGSPMQVPPAAFRLLSLAILTFALALSAGTLKPLQAMGAAIAFLLLYFLAAVIAYRSGWYADFVITPSCAVAAAIGGGLINALHTLRSRQRVVDLFGRYVPRDVVNELIRRSELEAFSVGGIERDISVLFADIRGFTSFSQELSPSEVVNQLNSLLEILVACTFEHGGTLDKFIGDAVLVIFNAPLDQVDHVARAARTALSMQKRLSGHPSGLKVGIGVHHGQATVGNIGTPQRMEYTAIGSTVNVASRLCDAAEPGQIVISKSVLSSLPPDFVTELIGDIQVKGIKQPLEVARLLDGPQ